MRASVLTLWARSPRASARRRVCACLAAAPIGARPVDQHIRGL